MAHASKRSVPLLSRWLDDETEHVMLDAGLHELILPMISDRDSAIKAVELDATALAHASPTLCGCREVVLAAVQQEGDMLRYASEELRGTREVVLAAAQQNGNAIRFASEELRSDSEVVLTAVKAGDCALQYASESLRGDRDLVLEAIRWDASSLWCAAAVLGEDPEFVRTAIRANGKALQWATQAQQDEPELFLEAARTAPGWAKQWIEAKILCSRRAGRNGELARHLRCAEALCSSPKSVLNRPCDANCASVDPDVVLAGKKKLTQVEQQLMAQQVLQDAVLRKSVNSCKMAIQGGKATAFVENVVKEAAVQVLSEVEEQSKARISLQRALRIRGLGLLQAALDRARSAGLPEEELERASRALEDEWLKDRIRSRLREASTSRDAEAILEAIRRGQDVGLKEEEFGEAFDIIEAEKRKSSARMGILAALDTLHIAGGPSAHRPETSGRLVEQVDVADKLRSTLDECRAAGLDEWEMQEVVTALAVEEQKVAARRGLHFAVKIRDLEALGQAMREAREAGLKLGDMKDANRLHEKLARRAQARQKLAAALASGGVNDIKAAMRECRSAGVEEDSDLWEAARKRVLTEDGESAVAARKAVLEALGRGEIGPLRLALEEAKVAGLAEEDLRSARAVLAGKERACCARVYLSAAVTTASARHTPGVLRLRKGLIEERLSEALEEGREAGLDADELTDALAALAFERRRRLVRQRLKDMTGTGAQEAGISTLQEVLAEARAVRLEDEQELMALAREKLAGKLMRLWALILEGLFTRDLDTLKEALRQGEEAGLGPKALWELNMAHSKEELLHCRRATLKSAAARRQLNELSQAIREAEEAGMCQDSDATLQLGIMVFEDETKKRAAESDLKAAMRGWSDSPTSQLEEIPGLAELLEAAGLTGFRWRAESWCDENNAKDVSEVLPFAADMADALGLTVTEKRLLEDAAASFDAEVAVAAARATEAADDVQTLASALERAIEVRLEPTLIEHASRELAVRRRRVEAGQRLRMAMHALISRELRAALCEGEAAGVIPDLMGCGRKSLQKSLLQEAIRSRNENTLRLVLSEAYPEQLKDLVHQAQEVLKGVEASRAVAMRLRQEAAELLAEAGMAVEPSEFRLSVVWNGRVDVDLYLFTPEGDLHHGNRELGQWTLNGDDRALGSSAAHHYHVESVAAPRSSMPEGTYRALVHVCGVGSTHWEAVLCNGESEQIYFQGSVSHDSGQEDELIAEFLLRDGVPLFF